MVDGRFAAHGRVHLRQQGGGHLHKRHTAHETGGGKAGHVAHHATAQCEQDGFAVAAVAQQGVKNQIQALPGFENLAVWQHHGVNLRVFACQRLLQARGIQRPHGSVGDDQRAVRVGQLNVT
jgi:hypothetical protein